MARISAAEGVGSYRGEKARLWPGKRRERFGLNFILAGLKSALQKGEPSSLAPRRELLHNPCAPSDFLASAEAAP